MNKDQLPKNGLEYLEAFPFYSSVLDVCQLHSEEREFAQGLVGQLLSGNMEIAFQSHSQSEEKLHHLHFESRIQERIGGQRCTALGFPLFAFKQGSSVRLAPLFIWRLNLDPDLHRPHFWSLRSLPGRMPELNPLLTSLFEKEAPLPPLPRGNGSLEAFIRSYGPKLAQWLEIDWQETWTTPFPVPPLEALNELADQRVILPCMVIGAFKPAFSANEAWQMEEKKPDRKDAFASSVFSPYQSTAWECAHNGAYTLIENKNDPEVQDWVISLLRSALANGERTLLISDRLSRLSRIQGKLAALGLDKQTFLLKDPYQDDYLLAELLKARAEQEDAPTPFPQNDYKVAQAKCIRYKEKLDQAYQALHKPLLGPYAWTHLVGMYLKSAAIEGKELLSSQLATYDFTFEYAEYEALKNIISQSIPLYNRINTLKHPLTALHASRFLEMDKASSLDSIQQAIDDFTRRVEGLNHEVLRQTDAYALKLHDHFENGYLALNARLQQAQDLFSDHANQYGESFEKTGAGAARLKGLFNKQARAMKDAQDEIAQAYLALARRHEEHNFFDFSFLSPSEAKNMGKARHSLTQFHQSLQGWRAQIRERVLEETTRLNRQTVHPELDVRESIMQLEEAIDAALGDINTAQLYSDLVDANMLTIPKKQKFLDALLEKLETTRLNLRDWDEFYDWQRHWLPLSEPQQRLVRALIKVKPQNWIAAFESWYFHHCLNRNFSDFLPTDEQALEGFYQSWTSLQGLMPGLTQQIWHERRQKAFKQWRKDHKSSYQNWVGKGKNEGLPRDWFGGAWEALHDLFPVWMLSDAQAAALYDAENSPELDWVVVWEHQDIETNFWKALAPKVKRWVFIGEEGGKVWEQLREEKWPVYPIREMPHGPLPSKAAIIKADIIPVNGLYDFSRRTNEAEAQETLRLLNEIRPTPNRTFPSVVILTLTKEQRNLIATYLLQIKQRNQQGAEKIRSLERNGLAVWHIDDFLGASFDHLIFSFGVGPVNMQGALPHDLSCFAPREWERTIWSLRHAGATSIQILHSFSDSLLSDSRLAPAKALFQLFSGYRRAADPHQAEQTPSVFYEEMSPLLKNYFDDWTFELAPTVEDYHPPLILGKQEYKTAVITDLFIGRAPHTSYPWEWEYRNHLREQGLHVHNAWSALYWRNPRQEARKLASRILASYNRSQKEETPSSDTQ